MLVAHTLYRKRWIDVYDRMMTELSEEKSTVTALVGGRSRHFARLPEVLRRVREMGLNSLITVEANDAT